MTRRSFTLEVLLPLTLAAVASALGACAHDPPRLALRAPSGDALVLRRSDVRAVRDVRDPERDGEAIAIDLGDAARARVKEFTSRHVGERVAFVVDEREVMAPVVRDPIDSASLLLTGRSDAEVESMRRALAAATPAR